MPQIGETISADDFKKLPAVGQTISHKDFISLPKPDNSNVEMPKEKGKIAKTYDAYSSAAGNFSEGFAKGGLTTMDNIQRAATWLGQKFNLPAQIAEFVTDGRMKASEIAPVSSSFDSITGSKDKTKELLTPEGTAQKVGFASERIAEFLMAGGPATKGINAAASAASTGASTLGAGKTAAGAINLAVQSAGQGAFTGGLTALQRGKFDDQAKVSALVGAAFPLITAGASALSQKIMHSNIKPYSDDVKDGFKPETISKYKLEGPLKTSLAKTNTKLNELGRQLDDATEASDATVDLIKVLDKVKDRAANKKTIKLGEVVPLSKGVETLEREMADWSAMMANPGKGFGALETGGPNSAVFQYNMNAVPIKIANNQIKRGASAKGAWLYGMMDKNARAEEQVYSIFYNELRKEIEKVGPKEIGAINKQMNELIPVTQAILRRIPVAERANVAGLAENMFLLGAYFDPITLIGYATTKALGSGTVANLLARAADTYFGSAAGGAIKGAMSATPEK